MRNSLAPRVLVGLFLAPLTAQAITAPHEARPVTIAMMREYARDFPTSKDVFGLAKSMLDIHSDNPLAIILQAEAAQPGICMDPIVGGAPTGIDSLTRALIAPEDMATIVDTAKFLRDYAVRSRTYADLMHPVQMRTTQEIIARVRAALTTLKENAAAERMAQDLRDPMPPPQADLRRIPGFSFDRSGSMPDPSSNQSALFPTKLLSRAPREIMPPVLLRALEDAIRAAPSSESIELIPRRYGWEMPMEGLHWDNDPSFLDDALLPQNLLAKSRANKIAASAAIALSLLALPAIGAHWLGAWIARSQLLAFAHAPLLGLFSRDYSNTLNWLAGYFLIFGALGLGIYFAPRIVKLRSGN